MAKEKKGNMEVFLSFESVICLCLAITPTIYFCIVNLQLKELLIHVLYAV